MHRVARALLLVMLATFLSPSFAWHMHAGHHEVEHSIHGDGHDHGHDHDANRHGEGSANDAHASIGHLLGHLAMHMSYVAPPIPAAARVAPAADMPRHAIASEASPPYRPPLEVRLA
jgi:hypothetical protein